MADARWTFRSEVDKYGPNPLEQDLRQASPAVHALAIKARPAPDLFSTGPLPPFLASGLPPEILNALPAGCRHAAAAMASPAEVYGLLDRVSGSPDSYVPSAGLDDYQDRMDAFSAGRDAQGRVVPVTDLADQDLLFEAMFGKDGEALNPPPPPPMPSRAWVEDERAQAIDAARAGYSIESPWQS
jgi:hypothetical protein